VSHYQYFKSNGTDHGHSQGHFQRKADEHAHWHLKRVAGLMGRWANFYAFERLVLAGPVAAASELYHLLPKRLRSRVVGELPLPVEAGERQVLEATLRFEQGAERAAEIKLVEELIVAAAKQARAATGLESTLNSLQQGRVWRLIYAARFAPRGGQCAHCGMLFGDGRGSCGYCGAAVRPVEDLIERTIERVTEAGGRTEQVRGAAAVRLRAAGGIGAVLRF